MSGRRGGWTAEDAREWFAPSPRQVPRWAVVVAHVLALGVAVGADAARPYVCTAAVPGPCAPDASFSLAIPFLLGAVGLLWWAPYAAVACSLVFAGLDVAYDDLPAANVAFVLAAGVAVAYALRRHALATRQRGVWRRLLRQVGVDAPRTPPARRAHGPLDGMARLRVLGAVALLAVAAATPVLYGRALDAEKVHLDRAVRVPMTVTGWSDEGALLLRRAGAADVAVPDRVSVDDAYGEYDDGAEVVLLRDPRDAGWQRLASEPADDTWWLTVGVLAAVGGLLLALREVHGRAQRSRLEGWDGRGVPVRVVVDGLDIVGVVPLDADVVLGEFATGERLRLARADDADRLEARPGLLVGDAVDGGWVAVDVEGARLLPEGPLRTLWGGEHLRLEPDPDDEDGLADLDLRPPSPLGPTDRVALPWTSGPPALLRIIGLAGLVLVPAAFAVGVTWLDLGWHSVLALLPASGLYVGALEWAFGRVELDAGGVRLRDGLHVVGLPWSAVEEVGWADGVLALEWEDGGALVDTAPGEAERVAGTAETLRRTAVSAGPEVPAARRTAFLLGWECALGALVVAVLAIASAVG